jgi:hypothetical protein
MLPGLNEAFARSGKPAAESVTGLDNSPVICTENEKFAESPEWIVCAVAPLGASVKSALPTGGVPTVNNNVEEVLGSKF